ncbi:hypothetical protein GGH95_002307 [Coemansia sp. RSA 1836]|nr:hypothetical protein GGH95_002307 [Coemansia sp. RSA 1836]
MLSIACASSTMACSSRQASVLVSAGSRGVSRNARLSTECALLSPTSAESDDAALIDGDPG